MSVVVGFRCCRWFLPVGGSRVVSPARLCRGPSALTCAPTSLRPRPDNWELSLCVQFCVVPAGVPSCTGVAACTRPRWEAGGLRIGTVAAAAAAVDVCAKLCAFDVRAWGPGVRSVVFRGRDSRVCCVFRAYRRWLVVWASSRCAFEVFVLLCFLFFGEVLSGALPVDFNVGAAIAAVVVDGSYVRASDGSYVHALDGVSARRVPLSSRERRVFFLVSLLRRCSAGSAWGKFHRLCGVLAHFFLFFFLPSR